MEEEEEGGKDLQKTKVLSLEWKIKGWWNTNNNKYNHHIKFYS